MATLNQDEIDLINCVAQSPAEALELIKLMQASKERNEEIKPKDQEN